MEMDREEDSGCALEEYVATGTEKEGSSESDSGNEVNIFDKGLPLHDISEADAHVTDSNLRTQMGQQYPYN